MKKIVAAVSLGLCLFSGTAFAYDAPTAPLTSGPAVGRPQTGLVFQHNVVLAVDVQAQLDQARMLVEQGKDYPLALATLTQVIEMNPNITEVFFLRGYTHNQMAEYDQADKDYESALMLEPTNAGLYYYRGLNWQQKFEARYPDGYSYYSSMLDKANKFFNKALKYSPNYVDAQIGLMDSDYDSHQYEDCLARVNKLLVLLPNNAVLQARKEDCQQKLAAKQKAEDLRKLKAQIND